jgi:hypothetical protein
VRLASRGQRDLDAGPESVSNAEERLQLRRQSRAVYAKTAITAMILTIISLLA